MTPEKQLPVLEKPPIPETVDRYPVKKDSFLRTYI